MTIRELLAIRDIQDSIWKAMEAKGFHDGRTGTGRDDTLVRLCLIHTEVSEAAQEVKRHWAGQPNGAQLDAFAEELADVAIRLFDLAGCTGVDLGEAISRKMVRNMGRPFLYGTPHARPDTTEDPARRRCGCDASLPTRGCDWCDAARLTPAEREADHRQRLAAEENGEAADA